MRVLRYRDLQTRGVARAFDKVCAFIEADDFKSADIKKLSPGKYYRASLDYANRLLLQFVKWQGQTVCLALEVIVQHAYNRSRFLRGTTVDFDKIEAAVAIALPIPDADTIQLRSMSADRTTFEMFDKPIVFDDVQEQAVALPSPLIIIGAAGSGKTAVTLCKLRQMPGAILYVTLSPYLAQSARGLYEALGYENSGQEAEFYSFREFLETLRVPQGRELTLSAFGEWFSRNRDGARTTGLDQHAMFEEFRGVLSADADGPLSLAAYQALGARQSLVDPAHRTAVFAVYEKYLAWMKADNWFDSSLIAHAWRAHAAPTYDFVVVDEVQDMTPVQLRLVLSTLKKPGQFLLCGDSHQIVHPNFFSWAAVKSMFWRDLTRESAVHEVHLLKANFRNTQRVTEVANRLLKLKQARFGSVDRESSFLVSSQSPDVGEVALQIASAAVLRSWDTVTQRSVNHAVIVLRDEDKPAAKSVFRTPLVFSVHEAKGLEYPHVVLFNIVSNQRDVYQAICEGVDAQDVVGDELQYRRAKDRDDKSLEIYKFYVNAMYVAMTRAMQTLTIVESAPQHRLFELLDLQEQAARIRAAEISSKEQWSQEARKLEQQGKLEQARAIRSAILQETPVPWPVWTYAYIEGVTAKALDEKLVSGKSQQILFDFALWHNQYHWIEELALVGFGPAQRLRIQSRLGNTAAGGGELAKLHERFSAPYKAKNTKSILWAVDMYGPDHRTVDGSTPLMIAARVGNTSLVKELLARGANPTVTDEFGYTAWMWFLDAFLIVRNRTLSPAVFETIVELMFELIAPSTIDVQTEGKLVRLNRKQAEYWFFTFMQTAMKGRVEENPFLFDAAKMEQLMERLPATLWPANRRKRAYTSGVLSRAAVDSPYVPARDLWTRVRTGLYAINPTMHLRSGDTWQPFYSAMRLEWIMIGNGNLYRREFRDLVAGEFARTKR